MIPTALRVPHPQPVPFVGVRLDLDSLCAKPTPSSPKTAKRLLT